MMNFHTWESFGKLDSGADVGRMKIMFAGPSGPQEMGYSRAVVLQE